MAEPKYPALEDERINWTKDLASRLGLNEETAHRWGLDAVSMHTHLVRFHFGATVGDVAGAEPGGASPASTGVRHAR